MLTVSDLKAACEVIEREHGSNGNIVIQIRDAEGSLINGTYVESTSRDSSGTLYLRGYNRGSRSKIGLNPNLNWFQKWRLKRRLCKNLKEGLKNGRKSERSSV